MEKRLTNLLKMLACISTFGQPLILNILMSAGLGEVYQYDRVVVRGTMTVTLKHTTKQCPALCSSKGWSFIIYK